MKGIEQKPVRSLAGFCFLLPAYRRQSFLHLKQRRPEKVFRAFVLTAYQYSNSSVRVKANQLTDEVSTESGSDRVAKLKRRDGTTHDPVATTLGTDFIATFA